MTENLRDLDLNSLTVEESFELLGRADIDAEERMQYVDTGSSPNREDLEFNQNAPGEDVSDELLAEGVDRADSWLAYNKGMEELGYSPAERITAENIDDIEEAYTVETGAGGLQVNPLVVPGDPPVMYFNTPNSQLYAINARTGEEYWVYQHDHGASRRAVAVSEDKVFLATGGEVMIALNRYTGEVEWETNYLWDEDLPEEMADYPQEHTGTSAGPIAYDGKVFVGMTGAGVQWSSFHAFDAETGEILWQVPNPAPGGWVGDVWAYGSSCNWMPPTIDPETETVLFNTGDPSSFWKTTHRPGPNKHSASIRAFSFDGENKWNHQVLAQEMWDYDVGSTPTVADVEVNGEERRVVMNTSKVGWVHLIDIETGRLLTRSEPFGMQEHRFGSWPDSEYLNMPEVGEENAGACFPHPTGLSQWPVDSYSPDTNMRYIGVQHGGTNVYAQEGNWLETVEYTDSTPANRAGGQTGGPDFENYTTCLAINASTGNVEWEYEFAAEGFGWPGGPTATGGGLVFAPSKDGTLVALDDENGDKLWSADTGGSISASPVVWDDPAEGAQYVTIAAGENVVTYRLEAETQTETATAEPTDTETATQADTEPPDTDTSTTSESGPGMGAGAGVAGVGGYAAKKLNDKRKADDDDEGDEV